MNVSITPNAWIQISKPGLRHNYAALRDLLAHDVTTDPQIIAVVKSNGFGHGAANAACAFQEAGADFFAVTTPAEALELRQAGINGRILVFLPPLPDQIVSLLELSADLTVCDQTGLTDIIAAAHELGVTARVHLKIDTGMGRLGALPEEALRLARVIAESPDSVFAGVYTHFARALEGDASATRRQFALFQQVTGRLQNEGISVGLRHCANSAATLRFPQMRLDAVRPGTILYGQYPSSSVPRQLNLQETWKLQARVISVRDIPRGTAIGYAAEHVTRRASRVAVLGIGYADGYTVAPASAASGMRGLKALLSRVLRRDEGRTVTIRDKHAPVLGRVAMQITSVDVTDVPGVIVGDVADIPCRRIMASARLPRFDED